MKSMVSTKLRIITECFIKPNHNDHHDASDNNSNLYCLGPMDLAFLSIEPMRKGLLFSFKDQDHDHDHDDRIQRLLSKLKRSISLSIGQNCYYPLAGQLATQKFPQEHACWIYVDCNKGPGARLLHAMVDLTVSDILSSDDVHPAVRSFFDLGDRSLNHDAHFRPLLTIQVTQLVDGVFIGFTMNHSIADGATLSNYISTLSEVFLQLNDEGNLDSDLTSISISHKPICKPFFPHGYGPILKLRYLEPNEFLSRYEPGPLREKIFHFSPSTMTSLKAQANKECGLTTISSLQALSSLLWRSITRARNLFSTRDLETTCFIVVNTRQRLDPPLSQHYFGNLIARASHTCKVEELMSRDLGWASLMVHEAIKAQDDNKIREFLKKCVEASLVAHLGAQNDYYRPNPVTIAGSAKFDLYGPEFGLGKALAVRSGFPNKEDGKVIVNPGCEGGGSVDLEICLRPQTMYALESDEEFMNFVSFDDEKCY